MRIKDGNVARKRRKKWLKEAKGYFGHKSIGFKVAKQQVVKSWTYAFRDRKRVKRDYRKLWISRINAASRQEGLSYSRFMNGLKKANVILDRKMLSEIAIHQPELFKKLVQQVKNS